MVIFESFEVWLFNTCFLVKMDWGCPGSPGPHVFQDWDLALKLGQFLTKRNACLTSGISHAHMWYACMCPCGGLLKQPAPTQWHTASLWWVLRLSERGDCCSHARSFTWPHRAWLPEPGPCLPDIEWDEFRQPQYGRHYQSPRFHIGSVLTLWPSFPATVTCPSVWALHFQTTSPLTHSQAWSLLLGESMFPSELPGSRKQGFRQPGDSSCFRPPFWKDHSPSVVERTFL